MDQDQIGQCVACYHAVVSAARECRRWKYGPIKSPKPIDTECDVGDYLADITRHVVGMFRQLG